MSRNCCKHNQYKGQKKICSNQREQQGSSTERLTVKLPNYRLVLTIKFVTAPGPLSYFDVVLHFDGLFKLIQLRWKLPHILDRNGVIQEFLLVDNSSLHVSSMNVQT